MVTTMQGFAVILVAIVTLATGKSFAQGREDEPVCGNEQYWDREAKICRTCTPCKVFSWPVIPCTQDSDTVCEVSFGKAFHFNFSMANERKSLLQIKVMTPTTEATVPMAVADEGQGYLLNTVLLTAAGLLAIAVVLLAMNLYICQRRKRKSLDYNFDSLAAPLARQPDGDCPRYTKDPTSLSMSSREMLKFHGNRQIYSSTSGHSDHLAPGPSSGSGAGPVLWFPSRDLQMYDSDSDQSGPSSAGSGSEEYVYIKKVHPGELGDPV